MQPRPSKGTTSPSWGSEDTQHHRDLPWIQHCELVCPNLFGFTLNTKQDIVITKALEAKKKTKVPRKEKLHDREYRDAFRIGLYEVGA